MATNIDVNLEEETNLIKFLQINLHRSFTATEEHNLDMNDLSDSIFNVGLIMEPHIPYNKVKGYTNLNIYHHTGK